LDRAQERSEENDVHELPVVEALKRKRAQETPVPVGFEKESDEARDEVDQEERGEEVQGALDVARGPKL
jgi:hypothetical protein